VFFFWWSKYAWAPAGEVGGMGTSLASPYPDFKISNLKRNKYTKY
jgi:hypothetical protein